MKRPRLQILYMLKITLFSDLRALWCREQERAAENVDNNGLCLLLAAHFCVPYVDYISLKIVQSLVGLNSTTISISFSQSPLSAPARFTHYADCRSARLACPPGQPSYYKTSQTMRDDIAPATRNLMTDDQSRSTFYLVRLSMDCRPDLLKANF